MQICPLIKEQDGVYELVGAQVIIRGVPVHTITQREYLAVSWFGLLREETFWLGLAAQ